MTLPDNWPTPDVAGYRHAGAAFDQEELQEVCETALDEASSRPLTQEEIAALRYAAGIPAPRPAYQPRLDLVDLANTLLGLPCHEFTK